MANDVVIEVEARVGDAIAQMTLTAAAVRALGDEASSASSTIGNENDGRTLSGRLGGLRRTLSNMGDRGPLGMVVRGFGNLASAMLAPIDLGFKFAQNFEQMGTVAQGFIGVVASLGIGLVGLAATIAAVTFAATALATILGTLVAIAADLVAPVTLLGGLLGGLAAGFVLAAKRATEGGHNFKDFNGELDKLGSMFHRTGTLLAQRFLPYFEELAHAGERALLFLDKIIKLPLGQAFRTIDTQGTKLLGQFVDRVSEVLSKPIRLAFRVAFEDTAFANMVSDWWHRFTGFLFGSIEQHPIRLPSGRIIEIDKKQVDGIFQPLIDWFNRHHFTRQGARIGRQILAGVLNSGMRQRIVDFLGDVFRDAGHRALRAFIDTFNKPVWPLVVKAAKAAWDAIDKKVNDAGHHARQSIIAALGNAWDWVKRKANNIWDGIVSKVESLLTVHISWPSPPSWVNKLFGTSGIDVVKSIAGSVTGSDKAIPFGHASPRVAAMAAPMIVNHFHIQSADLSDAPTRRRIAQQVGREITADWRRRAGGH